MGSLILGSGGGDAKARKETDLGNTETESYAGATESAYVQLQAATTGLTTRQRRSNKTAISI